MQLLFFILLAISTHAFANDTNLFGYFSQSAVISNGISIGGSTGNLSFDKNELTVFGDKSFSGLDIRLAVGTPDEPGLDEEALIVKYLLVDKQYVINDENVVGGRFGRVPHTLGFYNKTRNAPTVGQFIYLPEGIYREQFKYLAMSGDGVQAYWNWSPDKCWSFDVTGTYTKANLTSNREVVAGHFNDTRLGTFDEDKSRVKGISVEGRYRDILFYYNWINLYFWFKPDFPYSMMIPEARNDTNVHVAGIKKYYDNMDFSFEYLQVKLKGDVWDVVRQQTRQYGDPTGFVLSTTYHVDEKWDIAAYHSQYYTAINDKDGDQQSALTGLPASWFYVKSFSVASKYKIDDNWAVRAQYTTGKGIDPFIKTLNLNSEEKWDYLAAQAIFSF